MADTATQLAVDCANKLAVPLVICGDLHDTKANLRGECISAMRNTLSRVENHIYILVGNHDLINEKSSENALSFLDDMAEIVSHPTQVWLSGTPVNFIPYQHDPNQCRAHINTLATNSLIIMHQGVSGALSGEYLQDKSSILTKDVSGHRVISGHYHTRQTINLPDGGTWDYVGNPYTLTFAEANDPVKGYQILYDDGSLEFVPTNLRKHATHEMRVDERQHENPFQAASPGDLLWVRVKGSASYVSKLTKWDVAESLGIEGLEFRLDLIPDKVTTAPKANLTGTSLLDSIIDTASIPDDQKARLKSKWKTLLEAK